MKRHMNEKACLRSEQIAWRGRHAPLGFPFFCSRRCPHRAPSNLCRRPALRTIPLAGTACVQTSFVCARPGYLLTSHLQPNPRRDAEGMRNAVRTGFPFLFAPGSSPSAFNTPQASRPAHHPTSRRCLRADLFCLRPPWVPSSLSHLQPNPLRDAEGINKKTPSLLKVFRFNLRLINQN